MSHDTRPAPIRAAVASRDEVLPGIGKPQALFLLAAGISFLLSVTLWFGGSREEGLFVGIWVPSILSAGALIVGGSRRE